MAEEKTVDNFWNVQKIWAKTKNSPLALGQKGNGKIVSSGEASSGGVVTADEALNERLLKILDSRGSFDSYQLAQEIGKDHQQVVGAIKSVQSLGEVSLMTFDLFSKGV